MKESRRDAERWWKQAENDLAYARHGMSGGFYAQVCFQCHQVAEKAIKAVHYAEFQKRIVVGHSLLNLGREIGLEEGILDSVSILDQYYIPTRYPNGIPDAAPFEVYTRRQAKEALETAAEVLRMARGRIGG